MADESKFEMGEDRLERISGMLSSLAREERKTARSRLLVRLQEQVEAGKPLTMALIKVVVREIDEEES